MIYIFFFVLSLRLFLVFLLGRNVLKTFIVNTSSIFEISFQKFSNESPHLIYFTGFCFSFFFKKLIPTHSLKFVHFRNPYHLHINTLCRYTYTHILLMILYIWEKIKVFFFLQGPSHGCDWDTHTHNHAWFIHRSLFVYRKYSFACILCRFAISIFCFGCAFINRFHSNALKSTTIVCSQQ